MCISRAVEMKERCQGHITVDCGVRFCQAHQQNLTAALICHCCCIPSFEEKGRGRRERDGGVNVAVVLRLRRLVLIIFASPKDICFACGLRTPHVRAHTKMFSARQQRKKTSLLLPGKCDNARSRGRLQERERGGESWLLLLLSATTAKEDKRHEKSCCCLCTASLEFLSRRRKKKKKRGLGCAQRRAFRRYKG